MNMINSFWWNEKVLEQDLNASDQTHYVRHCAGSSHVLLLEDTAELYPENYPDRTGYNRNSFNNFGVGKRSPIHQ